MKARYLWISYLTTNATRRDDRFLPPPVKSANPLPELVMPSGS